MGIYDDATLRRLAKNLGQTRDRHYRRVYNICQHLAGTDRGQLIDITDDEQGRLGRDRLEKRVHQQHVHHRGFVDNQQVAVERQ